MSFQRMILSEAGAPDSCQLRAWSSLSRKCPTTVSRHASAEQSMCSCGPGPSVTWACSYCSCVKIAWDQAPRSGSSGFQWKEGLTRNNISTPFGLNTSLEHFLFCDFRRVLSGLLRAEEGQVEVWAKGGVFRAVLYFPWPTGRSRQRLLSGPEELWTWLCQACLLLCFLGMRGDRKGVRLRPRARTLHLWHLCQLSVCTGFEPDAESVWKFLRDVPASCPRQSAHSLGRRLLARLHRLWKVGGGHPAFQGPAVLVCVTVIVRRHQPFPASWQKSCWAGLGLVEWTGVREFCGALKGHSWLTSFLVHSHIF